MKIHLKKRVIFPLFALLSIALWMLNGHLTYDARFQKEVEYYAQINELIKDESFRWTDIGRNGIQLLDENHVLLKTIDFPGCRWQYRPDCYRDGEDSIVYFATSRAVDDEIGVLFVNGSGAEALYALNGIQQLRRVGSNTYYYDTASYNTYPFRKK